MNISNLKNRNIYLIIKFNGVLMKIVCTEMICGMIINREGYGKYNTL